MSANRPPVGFTLENAQGVLDDSPFGQWWGFVVESVGQGTVTVRLPWRAEFLRPGNLLQGRVRHDARRCCGFDWR